MIIVRKNSNGRFFGNIVAQLSTRFSDDLKWRRWNSLWLESAWFHASLIPGPQPPTCRSITSFPSNKSYCSQKWQNSSMAIKCTIWRSYFTTIASSLQRGFDHKGFNAFRNIEKRSTTSVEGSPKLRIFILDAFSLQPSDWGGFSNRFWQDGTLSQIGNVWASANHSVASKYQF